MPAKKGRSKWTQVQKDKMVATRRANKAKKVLYPIVEVPPTDPVIPKHKAGPKARVGSVDSFAEFVVAVWAAVTKRG